jgi:nucleoid-associated protein YgaU
MDLRTYYQKIRAMEATIPTEYTVVISKATDDGGKSGVPVEVSREVAAKMVVEGSAALATAEEAAAFRAKQAAANKAAKEAAAAEKVSVTVVSSDELRKLTDDLAKLKGKSRNAEG